MDNLILELQSVTFGNHSVSKVITFTESHAHVPTVTATLINSTNANFKVFIVNTTLTTVALRLSAPAPFSLEANVHIISRVS
jgi:hypothetical protein